MKNENESVTIEVKKGQYRIVGITGNTRVYSKRGNDPAKTFFIGDTITEEDAHYIFGTTRHIKLAK